MAGPIDQPNFHPVILNILPALPIVIVRSYMPGIVAETRLIHNSYGISHETTEIHQRNITAMEGTTCEPINRRD